MAQMMIFKIVEALALPSKPVKEMFLLAGQEVKRFNRALCSRMAFVYNAKKVEFSLEENVCFYLLGVS